MNLGTPEGCREEADRLESMIRVSDWKQAVRHADKCRELRLIAAKLERDEAKTTA